jgi:tRNA U34 5-methylaminomethyl-2-thiouridine-forming methyltransferase MnmC
MAIDVSDNVPCAIMIQTEVPKPKIFRFENFWLEHSSFQAVLQQAWALPSNKFDPALRLTSKLKASRKHIKDWQKNIAKLATTIENTKFVTQFLDMIEESRDLEMHE